MKSTFSKFAICIVGLLVIMGSLTTAFAAEGVPGVTNTSVKIGIIHFLTGSMAYLGKEAVDAMEMYFDEVNKSGGIHGRKIETVVDDDPCQVAKGIATFKRLVDSAGVFAVMSGQCSNSAVAMLPLVNESKVPTIVTCSTSPAITSPFSRYIFRTGFINQKDMIPALADYVVNEFKAKKIGYLRLAGEWSQSASDLFTQRLAKFGLKPVAEEFFNLGDTDYTSQLFRLKNADADAIILWAYEKEGAIIVRQAMEQGVKSQWFSPGISSVQFLPLVKEAGVGFIGVYLARDLEEAPKTKAAIEFKQKYENKYPLRAPGTPDYLAFVADASARVVVEGLKRAGKDLTREKFIDALETIQNFETGTYFPTTFSKTDHQGVKEAGLWKIVAPGKREMLPVSIKAPRD